jgi:hypothetical protein
VVVVILAVLAAFFLWGSLVNPLVNGADPGATVLVFAMGMLLAGLLVWIVLGGSSAFSARRGGRFRSMSRSRASSAPTR